ncbi:hypothetical protein [Streptomyces sp. ODS28]|uniref:hypothetical protein n=1 Tax=Streptomyces sp. ODS28 TaxID=3136688 RepID=UPI0031EEF946
MQIFERSGARGTQGTSGATDAHHTSGPSGTSGPAGANAPSGPTRSYALSESLPLFAGAAVGIGGVGAALALADVDSPLRAPFTLFFLFAAPATAIAAALRSLDPLIRTVTAVIGAAAFDLLVAQVMLATHVWSVRGGVLAVGVLSAALLLLTLATAPPDRGARGAHSSPGAGRSGPGTGHSGSAPGPGQRPRRDG